MTAKVILRTENFGQNPLSSINKENFNPLTFFFFFFFNKTGDKLGGVHPFSLIEY